MKKIGKITINPEKVIKNEELVNLRGGYESDPCTCTCQNISTYECIGYVFAPDGDCRTACREWICGNTNCDWINGTCGNPGFC